MISKRQEALNRLREIHTSGNSGDTTLCPNCWAVTEVSLQNILVHCLSSVVGWNFKEENRFGSVRSSHRLSN